LTLLYWEELVYCGSLIIHHMDEGREGGWLNRSIRTNASSMGVLYTALKK